MVTRYFSRIISFFFRQHDKREDNHTVNGVFGDWTTSYVEDVPPPYTDSPVSKVNYPVVEYLPPPPFQAPCLRICPHETMSFEYLQQVVKPLATRPMNEVISALTTSCHDHRNHRDPTIRKTKTVCTSSPGLLTGSGTYALEDGKNTSHILGIVLCFDWDLGLLDALRCQVESAVDLQHLLGAEGIPLCPHKQMSDSEIINAIFGFLKTPSSRDSISRCGTCDTEIEVVLRLDGDDQICHVKTKRYLGTLEELNDPVWLAQCSV